VISEEKLSSLRDHWASYHHHKEQMAFSVATLYLAAATAVVFKAADFWPPRVPHWLIVKLLIATAILAFAFVGWQLRNRETAAGIVRACEDLLRDGANEANREDAPEPPFWRGVPLPVLVTRKIEELSRRGEFLAGPKSAAFITYAAMGAWTLAAIVALTLAA